MRWFYKIIAGFLAALIVVAAVFYFSKNSGQDSQELVVTDSSSGRVLGRWPLEEPGEFAIEFIHSVNQSQVREFFRIKDGQIHLFAVRFSSFGAGMQSDLGEGHIMSRDGDAMIISGLDVSFEQLNYIVGTVSDHFLIIGGEYISLRELFGRNAQISIHFR